MFNFIKSYKKLSLFLLAITALAGVLFYKNYRLQLPYQSKHIEAYGQVWNDRATCLQQLEVKSAIANTMRDIEN